MNSTTINNRTYAASIVTFGLVALGHAILTWPTSALLVLFGGGALLAFAGEAIVIHFGLLEHHIGPKLLGVPLYVLFGWTGVLYVCFRIALLITTGWVTVVLTALLATGFDIRTDPAGVADGRWTYTDNIPGPRHNGVPWWNYTGWFLICTSIATLTAPYLS